ncbi:MAG: hypothetical protein AAF798_14550 [Bacteroidota bacterium]
MKYLTHFLLFLLFPICTYGQAKILEISKFAAESPANERSIYLDLGKETAAKVIFNGSFTGKRLVLQNASNKHVVFDCTIRTTDLEHAIIISGDVQNLILESTGKEMTGGIGVWGSTRKLSISGFNIVAGKFGVHATAQKAHTGIQIYNNSFRNIQLEAIYWGYFQQITQKTQGISIIGNTFQNIGWDAIQIGNALDAEIYDNKIDRAGLRNEFGQDYAITINPGSRCFLYNNEILNTGNRVQCLESTMFETRK